MSARVSDAVAAPLAGERAVSERGQVAHSSVTRAAIDASHLLARVGGDQDGAVILFLGTVRDHNDGRKVGGVHYEAYEQMADEVLAQISEEAAAELRGGSVAVVHRVGELAIGEVSVAVAVSSPHRAEAYQASRYVIEEIKKRLPVWKQERYLDGEQRWLSGHEPQPDPPGRGEGEAA